MSYKCLAAILSIALSTASLVLGQVTLNPTPSRVVGHPRLQLSNGNPNLVEGRELYSPQGIAVDTSGQPADSVRGGHGQQPCDGLEERYAVLKRRARRT